jgi:16S rRNA (cytidine1402-2'-O)-methyltransferase
VSSEIIPSKGILYIFPFPLANSAFFSQYQPIVSKLTYFVCESQKGFISFLANTIGRFNINDYEILINNEHTSNDLFVKNQFLSWLKLGVDIGLVSDIGLPSVADPGSELVLLAHLQDYKVYPLVYESSIMAALCASGLNGQQFMFHGYPPYETSRKAKFFEQLLKDNTLKKYTHLFIEAPYRSQAFFENLLHLLPDDALLSITVEAHAPDMLIKTDYIRAWKTKPIPSLKKKRVVFLFKAYQ